MPVKRSDALAVLFILMFSVALYANTLKNGFVIDDEDTIVKNLLIKDLRNLPKLFTKAYFHLSSEWTYRPVVTFSYFVDYRLFGLKAWGFHLTNVLLHAMNGALLYVFLTFLFRHNASESYTTNPPLLISLLFATHPVLTEAVNVISFREDLLVFLLYMATVTIYLVLQHSANRPWFSISLYLLSCFLYIVALFSKEMAATLPLTVYCYERIYGNKSVKPPLILLNPYNIGYIIITLIYSFIYFSCLRDPAIEVYIPLWSLDERLLTLPWLLLNYLKIVIFPVSLSSDYEINPIRYILSTSFVGPLIIIASIITVSIVWRRNKIMAFGILFFLVTLMPVYNIFPLVMPMAERYLYLPMVGFVIVGWLLINRIFESLITDRQNLYMFIIWSCIVAVFAIIVVNRNTVWRDEYSLWTDTIRKMPKSSRVHNNLGKEFFKQDRIDEAIKEFKTAVTLNPKDAWYHANLGSAYAEQGNIDEGIKKLQTALKIDPDNSEMHSELGALYLKKGLRDKSRQEYEISLKIKYFFQAQRAALESVSLCNK